MHPAGMLNAKLLDEVRRILALPALTSSRTPVTVAIDCSGIEAFELSGMEHLLRLRLHAHQRGIVVSFVGARDSLGEFMATQEQIWNRLVRGPQPAVVSTEDA
jgi:anti-anti-sigma regulatory factor